MLLLINSLQVSANNFRMIGCRSSMHYSYCYVPPSTPGQLASDRIKERCYNSQIRVDFKLQGMKITANNSSLTSISPK